jgi:dihydropyrimidinase
MQPYDLIIRNGTIGSSLGTQHADLAIREGKIAKIGSNIAKNGPELDAAGMLILPGGVDSHCHIEQLSGAGLMNADTFETATRSAVFGGTTTTISFAAQHPGMRLRDTVSNYAKLAENGALIDHAFHVIVADTSGENLTQDLPALIAQGHRSIKIFTTYDKVRLDDEAILDTLCTARDHGALVCFHAENDGLIRWATKRLLAAGKTAPMHHPASHPRLAEIEAISRMCYLSQAADQPIIIFHVSTVEGLQVLRDARARGVQVVAETCPHYLFQGPEILNQPGNAGAAFMCSPPQRNQADRAALWAGLAAGDLQAVTSDHAPYRMDATGKFAHGPDAPFNRIANGMPGLEVRLPLMFDAMINQRGLPVADFVRLTATNPARIFGLTGKGDIAPGMDADIAIWDPLRQRTFGPNDLHDNCGYNPFEGHSVTGWPVTVLSRGEVIVQDGAILGQPGRGSRIPMEISPAMTPKP